MNIELSIIIPTYNEKDNIRPLCDSLEKALQGIIYEIIFVDDDSSDQTADIIKEISQNNNQIRCLHRIGKRGLASACIEGVMASAAPYVAVMDADLQHDETLLMKMLSTIKEEKLDLVVASRYVEGGDTEDWSKKREWISLVATRLGQMFMRVDIKDPLSGFFLIKRASFIEVVHHLSAKGYKILLDILMSSKRILTFKELPYHFRNRHAGESKLDGLVAWEYFLLIADKALGRYFPVRFILFVIVGLFGAFFHLGTLSFCFHYLQMPFVQAQAIAIILAINFNFLLNNEFTYQDLKLRGAHFLRGLLSFFVACSLGAVINMIIALYLYQSGIEWWISGLLGAVIGSVWNYAITKTFTWMKV